MKTTETKMDAEMIDAANKALAQFYECDTYKVVADPEMLGGIYIDTGGSNNPLASDVHEFALGCIWALTHFVYAHVLNSTKTEGEENANLPKRLRNKESNRLP